MILLYGFYPIHSLLYRSMRQLSRLFCETFDAITQQLIGPPETGGGGWSFEYSTVFVHFPVMLLIFYKPIRQKVVCSHLLKNSKINLSTNFDWLNLRDCVIHYFIYLENLSFFLLSSACRYLNYSLTDNSRFIYILFSYLK